MRLTLASSLLCAAVLSACGGGNAKPATTEADTSSLESSSTPSSASTGSAPATSPADSPASSGAADKPASSGGAPAAADRAAAAPAHPVPGATGDIDGKAFAPKLAQLVGAVQKDGRATVLIHGGSDCLAVDDAKAGDGSILLVLPWKDGFKTDLSALRRAKGKNLGEAAFVRNKQVSTSFKPSGLVTIVSAPTAKGTVGKMKIDLQSGGYILAGDLDVMVCGSR
jgi:hypothetical protein